MFRIGDCPRCGRTAKRAGQAAYCPKCGWKHTAALRSLGKMARERVWYAPVFLAASLVFFSLGNQGVGLFFAIVAVVNGSVWASYRLRVRWMEQARPKPADEEGSTGAFPQPGRHRNLLNQRPPRRLRLKRQFRVLALIWIPILAVFVYVSARSIVAPVHPSDVTVAGVMLAIVLLVAIAVILGCYRGWKNARLLREGEVTLGRVRTVFAERKGTTTRRVEFTYKDAAGREHDGESFDWNGEFYTEMFIPVFYDRNSPYESKAICASIFDIRP